MVHIRLYEAVIKVYSRLTLGLNCDLMWHALCRVILFLPTVTSHGGGADIGQQPHAQALQNREGELSNIEAWPNV